MRHETIRSCEIRSWLGSKAESRIPNTAVVNLVGLLSCIFVLLGIAHGNVLAGYLKDWQETRIVVDISESATTNLGAVGDQIEKAVAELLAQDPVGLTVKTQSHGYLYLRIIADVVPEQQYFGVLDVRVVRPVVVVPIGKVAVAAIWEETVPLTGPVKNFAVDLQGALRKALLKLKEDWRQDNGAGR